MVQAVDYQLISLCKLNTSKMLLTFLFLQPEEGSCENICGGLDADHTSTDINGEISIIGVLNFKQDNGNVMEKTQPPCE